ncbi:MAG: PKD domain-containing protein [Bacteroidetes bacterium]|nr:PKD domain-containing protein [Bacteroidota bacterium]
MILLYFQISDINGCKNNQLFIFVFPIPNAIFGIGSISSCATPATVTFANTSTNTSDFLWDFGDPTSSSNTSILANPSHTYNAPGNYLVTLTSGVTGMSLK